MGDVLVVAHSAGPAFIAVILEDGSIRSQDGLALDPETSAQILGHGSPVRRLDVYLGLKAQGPTAEPGRKGGHQP